MSCRNITLRWCMLSTSKVKPVPMLELAKTYESTTYIPDESVGLIREGQAGGTSVDATLRASNRATAAG